MRSVCRVARSAHAGHIERERDENYQIAVETHDGDGWMDYYVYGQAFGGDISNGKPLVGAAVRQ